MEKVEKVEYLSEANNLLDEIKDILKNCDKVYLVCLVRRKKVFLRVDYKLLIDFTGNIIKINRDDVITTYKVDDILMSSFEKILDYLNIIKEKVVISHH